MRGSRGRRNLKYKACILYADGCCLSSPFHLEIAGHDLSDGVCGGKKLRFRYPKEINRGGRVVAVAGNIAERSTFFAISDSLGGWS